MADFEHIGDVLGPNMRVTEDGVMELSDAILHPPTREVPVDESERKFGAPTDTLLQWNSVPRRYIDNFDNERGVRPVFTARVKGTMWDSHYHAVTDTLFMEDRLNDYYPLDAVSDEKALFERKSYYDMELEHAGKNVILAPEGVWRTPYILTKRIFPELIGFPFVDADSIVQFQDAVETVRSDVRFRSAEWMNSLDAVALEFLESIGRIQMRQRMLRPLEYDRLILDGLDQLVDAFPRSNCGLFEDLRAILATGRENDSPIGRYKEIVRTGNFKVIFDGKNDFYCLQPTTTLVDKETSSIGEGAEGLILKSVERKSAIGVISDAITLIGLATQVAHAVEYWGLAKAEFGSDIDIRGAVHPLFYAQDREESQKRRFRNRWELNESVLSERQYVTLESTPNDFVYGPDGRIMLITGLTEGGKTTAVRTASATVCLAQAIGYTTAKSYRAPVFQQFSSLFGAGDDFEEGNSSFKSQVLAVNKVYVNRRIPTWVGADEFFQTNESGTGTEVLPNMLCAMTENGMYGALATHHHQGADMLMSDPRFPTGHITDELFFKLQNGVTLGGYALRAAVRAELHPDLLGPNAGKEIVEPVKPVQRITTNDIDFYVGTPKTRFNY